MASRGIAPELLEPFVRRIFFKRLAKRAEQYKELFNVETSSRAFEDTFAIAGLGTFTVKPEGVPVTYDDPVQGDRKRTIMLTFALAFRVTMEMMEDDQHGIISKMPSDLSDAGDYSMETLCAGLMNDAFSGSSYTGLPEGDGTRRALCSTSHVLLKDGVTTWSNSLSPAVALSTSGIEAAITLARKQKGEEGRYVQMRLVKLVVPPELEWTARKLLDTDREPFSADNTSNEIGKEGITIMSWVHLSSATRWWMTTEKSQTTLTFYKRKGISFGEATDSDTFDRKFMAHWRGNVTFDDPRGVVGSNAS